MDYEQKIILEKVGFELSIYADHFPTAYPLDYSQLCLWLALNRTYFMHH